MTSLFPIQDLHVHSIFSDGAQSVDEILEIANGKGYVVGIADHASPEDKIVNDVHLLAYLDALERYPVYRSVEMDVELGCDLSAGALSRLDYVVVGIHFLTLRGVQAFFWDPLAILPDPEEVVEGYVATAERAMATMRMEIFAHPTLLPLALRADADALWTKPRVQRLVRAAVANHVALEISGHWQVPNTSVIEEAVRQGAALSLGSDGHGADSMCDLEYPLAMMRQLGIGPHQLFKPARDLR